jgi:hypothetical protein
MMKSKQYIIGFLLCLSHIVMGQETAVAQPAQSAEEVAKKLANPVSSMISVPLQNNMQYGIGEFNGSKYTVNIQPIIPISLGAKVNLITRYILPVVDQRDITGENTSQIGLSDMTISGYFMPKETGKTFFGIGPILLLPTATDEFLGTKKWSAGPTIIGVSEFSGGAFGALINQIWSIAGDEERSDVNQLFVQGFYTHTYKSGASVGINVELTQNWEGKTTMVIFNGPSLGAVTAVGKQKIQLSLMPMIPLLGPSEIRPDWGIRGSITFVFIE